MKKKLTKRDVAILLQNYFMEHPDQVFSFKKIFHDLKLDTHPLKMLAIDIMEDMAWDDFLTKASDNSYRLNTKTQLQEGRFRRKQNGKNSFVPEDGSQPIFVAERNSLGALDGDKVQVTFLARREKHIKEAIVTKILQRAKDTFAGVITIEEDIAFLTPQDNQFSHDILVPRRKTKGAKTGDKVVVRITQWADADHKNIIGEVIDVLGHQGENDAEMHAILAQYGLPYKYPEEVERAADKIDATITEADYAVREDYRDVFTCTIDPRDAKDFDDALSLRRLDNGLWEVGVHIADVSHYVPEGSIIDREAFNRATSVYLVDRTIPMLPERLCNFICSLRPDEEKLAYSCIFEMNDNAEVKRWHVARTVIKSNRRFAYEEVQEILERYGEAIGTAEPTEVPHTDLSSVLHTDLTDSTDSLLSSAKKKSVASVKSVCKKETEEYVCLILNRLAKHLRIARFKNGAVKFEREELHFEVDEKGKPTRCFFKMSKDANKLIEEFMLLANRSVAELVAGKAKNYIQSPKLKTQNSKLKTQNKLTMVYRVHDQPDPTKLETLRSFVVNFGYKLKTAGTKGAISKSLNALMDDCQGRREQKLIETVALRAMMKAKYSVHNIGHYGLAFDHYTHFTSPIRRYPDTMVHRLLTRYLNGGKSVNAEKMEEKCKHSSDMEIVAASAERDSIKYKMVEFMEDKIGNVYDAHISGIQSYGLFCEIDENHCEGLVPIIDLDDDYYDFDEKNYCLIGRRNRRKYQLGDPIKIRVAKANVDKKQLDFTIEK